MAKRTRYTHEFKAEVVLEALSGESSHLRVDNFENGSTVGKKEIYKLTPELRKFIESKSTDT